MPVRFTSTHIPPSRGLVGSCQLPFGCVVSCFAPISDDSNTAATTTASNAVAPSPPKVICLSCLSYLNPYCPFDGSTGRWTCSICGYEDNAADPAAFTSSVVTSNVVEYVQRSASASADAQDTTTPPSRCVVLVLDGNLLPGEVQSVLRTLRPLLSSRDKGDTTIGLVIFGKTISIYQLGLAAGLASADIYSGNPFPSFANVDAAEGDDNDIGNDDNLANRAYLERVASGGLDALERCCDAYFGFDAERANASSTDSKPAPSSSTVAPLSRREMLRKRREERARKEAARASTKTKTAADSTIQPSPSSQSTRSTSSSARQKRRLRRMEREKKRCTGEAIRRAINLAGSAMENEFSQRKTGRVLLFTCGCPNYGPGSVVASVLSESTGNSVSTGSASGSGVHAGQSSPSRKDSPRRQRRHAGDIIEPVAMAEASDYYNELGKDAFDSGIGVDIFCSGSTSLGVPALQALVNPSDGYVLTNESFASDAAAADVRHVFQNTYMSRAGGDHSHHGGPSATGDLELNTMNGCVVDVRTPIFLEPTNVVGPGTVEYDEDRGVFLSEKKTFAECSQRAAALGLPTNHLPNSDVLSTTLTRLRLGRYDPSITHTVVGQVCDEFRDENFGVFQFVSRYVTQDGLALITRVCTSQLPIAQNAGDFISGMQDEVVSLVLGREAVYRSISGRGNTGDDDEVAVIDRDEDERLANDARKDVDATIHLASSAFRRLGQHSDSNVERASLNFAFPSELSDGLQLLYNLRRGPLLGSGPIQSSDDRAVSRALFLRLSLDECLLMAMPMVWCCRCDTSGGFSFERFPTTTLSCWDDVVLAVDQFDTLCVWSGRKSFGPEYDPMRQACKDYLLSHSQHRFPSPQVLMLKEGDSMSRRLLARLQPAHGDPPEHQIAYFPALSNLSPSELGALRDKFRFYDPKCDPSFRRWFWEVASATSQAGKEGLSLCE